MSEDAPERSPSSGWRETYNAMGVNPDLPDQLEESANELRNIGFDELAEALEQTAEKARGVRTDA